MLRRLVVLALFLAIFAGAARAFAFESNGHAIVVLGLVLRDDGSMEPALRARMEKALEEAQRDPRAYVVVTGGGGRKSGRIEAHAMRDWLVERIPAERILVEDESLHTKDNAQKTSVLLSQHGVSRVTLVTNAFHMARGLLEMRAALRREAAVAGHERMATIVVGGAAAPNGERGLPNVRRNLTEPYRFARGVVFDWYEGDLRLRQPIATAVEVGRVVRGRAAGLGKVVPRQASDRQPPAFTRAALRLVLDYQGGRSNMFRKPAAN